MVTCAFSCRDAQKWLCVTPARWASEFTGVPLEYGLHSGASLRNQCLHGRQLRKAASLESSQLICHLIYFRISLDHLQMSGKRECWLESQVKDWPSRSSTAFLRDHNPFITFTTTTVFPCFIAMTEGPVTSTISAPCWPVEEGLHTAVGISYIQTRWYLSAQISGKFYSQYELERPRRS